MRIDINDIISSALRSSFFEIRVITSLSLRNNLCCYIKCVDIFMLKLTKCEISPDSGNKTDTTNIILHGQFTSIKCATLYCLGRRGWSSFKA